MPQFNHLQRRDDWNCTLCRGTIVTLIPHRGEEYWHDLALGPTGKMTKDLILDVASEDNRNAGDVLDGIMRTISELIAEVHSHQLAPDFYAHPGEYRTDCSNELKELKKRKIACIEMKQLYEMGGMRCEDHSNTDPSPVWDFRIELALFRVRRYGLAKATFLEKADNLNYYGCYMNRFLRSLPEFEEQGKKVIDIMERLSERVDVFPSPLELQTVCFIVVFEHFHDRCNPAFTEETAARIKESAKSFLLSGMTTETATEVRMHFISAAREAAASFKPAKCALPSLLSLSVPSLADALREASDVIEAEEDAKEANIQATESTAAPSVLTRASRRRGMTTDPSPSSSSTASTPSTRSKRRRI